MKIKPILSIISTVIALSFLACDDDINPIGGSIQPDGDVIYLGVDTFDITAKTVKWNSIYARTSQGLLGEHEDPVFGKVKSDYLCEFFASKKLDFEKNYKHTDSMYVIVYMNRFVGDSISPIGLSAYRASRKLERDFYTDFDPAKYCDMKNILGKNVFSVINIPKISGYVPAIKLKVKNSIGDEFHNKWLEDPSIFHDPDSLKEYLPGIYVTQTLGTNSLIDVNSTEIVIHYTYNGRNYNDTKDSLRRAVFQMGATPEVIQMNRVQNNNIDKLLVEGDPKRTYFKTPAGVYTEVTIPLSKIANIVKKDTLVNSASLYFKGFTDEEQYSDYKRPDYLLLINKDSVDNFFTKRKMPDNTTSFIVERNRTTNVYDFQNGLAPFANIPSGNIPKMINHYLTEYRKDKYSSIPDLKYMLIPVSVTSKRVQSGYNYVINLTGVYNLMRPTSAIIRTDEDNMKFPIVYSKYKDR